MAIGAVVGLWRYPVKSMRGEELNAVAVSARGLAGDRAYALLDRASGKIASAKHPRLWGRLLACRATVAGPPQPGTSAQPVRVTLPDGRVIVVGRDDADAALSALLSRAVALSTEPPVAAEIERYWPDVDGLALRDTVTAGPIGLGAPPGAFVDYAPVHLLTTSTLARLQALHSDGCVDVRRFRPNLVVAPTETISGFIENTWVGRTLLIGTEVLLRVTDPTPRCVMPTLPQQDVPRDIGILRAVALYNRPPIPALGGVAHPSLGAYAVVERGGSIRRGDPVRFADDSWPE